MSKELKDKIERLLTAANRTSNVKTPWVSESIDELRTLLEELQPYDIATVLPGLSEEERIQLLRILPATTAAEALEHLDYDSQYRLLDHMGEAPAKTVLTAMSSDALTDLIHAIHPKQAARLLGLLPEPQESQIRRLMEYPANSAGGRMTADYLAVRQDWSNLQATAHFRKVGQNVEVTNYFYVVDKDGRLVGVASMREVFLGALDQPIHELMYTKVVTVQADADQEEAARLLSQYDFVALPVLDNTGRIVGVITSDDVIDVIEEEATEDIQKMGGTTPLDEPYLQTTFFGMYRKRIGWLMFLFVAALATSNILEAYEEFLDQVIALTFFIPLLIDTGGNSGSQAATLVIRAMALGEVTFKDFFRVVWREARLGLALGATMAVAVFLRALFMDGGIELGLTVASTISLIVLTGSTVGAALPLIGRRLGFDPALLSAPIITTIADVTGLVIYFQMARMFMGLGH